MLLLKALASSIQHLISFSMCQFQLHEAQQDITKQKFKIKNLKLHLFTIRLLCREGCNRPFSQLQSHFQAGTPV